MFFTSGFSFAGWSFRLVEVVTCPGEEVDEWISCSVVCGDTVVVGDEELVLEAARG